MCTNTELQTQIKKIEKKTDGNCKLLEDHGKTLEQISQKIDDWTPYIQKELQRSSAYQIVADDLKSKGVTWQFWLGLIALVLTLVAATFALAEKFHWVK